ncbi:uncharacterized protein [Dermacentor andersoni]|uniref:uncharacterized protein isoform X1 n=1 Tax=Dermacentor andersoni TaxID=34620 RepID=UPI002415BCBE|nr:uncharacterized protein LOC126519821 isoform X1 [Dermacentor andersoni]
MSTDERHLLIMVERLPDEIAQVYSRTKQKKSLQHRNSFKHRKLKSKAKDGECGESDGTVLSPAARETGKLTTVTPSHLPMSLPMYSRSISLPSTLEEKTEAGNRSLKVKVKVEPRVKVKIKPNKRGRSLDSNKVLRKIKIRKISKDALSPSAPEKDENTDTKVVFGKDIEEGSSKGPSEKYEIVSSSGRVTDLHEESGAVSEESIDAEQNTITEGNVEAWLRDHVGQPSERMKGDTGSISEESTVEETETSDDSSVNQETESYNTDHEDFEESDGSQRTEIDAANCTSSDTEIDEAEQCQPKVASSVGVETVALMSNEGSCHSDMLQECSTALEHIVSEVCAEKQVPLVADSGNSGNKCVENIKAETVPCNSASAETEYTSVQPNEIAEQVTAAEVRYDDLCDDEQKETASSIEFIDITEDALVLSPEVEGPNPPAKTVMPPDSSTGEPNNGNTSCSVDVVDLTSDDVDCYVVSPVNEDEVAATSGMTGVCMAAAKELDLFANMTILESWDIEAESILACTGEYLGHLEKCLTSLDLMGEAFKTMLVTALRKKSQAFKQIFVLLKKLLCRSEQLNRVLSVESGFFVLLGIENPSNALCSHRISGTEAKEPNSATRALIRRLSAAVNDDHAKVLVEKTTIAQEVPSAEHRPSQRVNSANECDLSTISRKCSNVAIDPPPNRARTTWRHLVAAANRRERECTGFRAVTATVPVVSQSNERRASLGMSFIRNDRAVALTTARVNLESHIGLQRDRSSSSQSTCSIPNQQLDSRSTTQQPNSRSTTASNLQIITQRQLHRGQPIQKQGNDPSVSTLLKELKQIANGSFKAPSTNADAREKVVNVEAKQAQPLRQATVTSTSVATSPLLSVSSVTSASLGRQISLLPVATVGCSSKVTALPVNVTVLPAATSVSAPVSSATTTSTTSTSVVGGTKSDPQASTARASPHSILQKLQRNTGLTVVPVQQREKLAKEDAAADGSSSLKNILVEVTAASSETASVSRDSVIAVPSGLSITSTPARASTADKTATRTSEQVAVIQLGKGSQRHLPLPAAKPAALAVSTTSGGRVNLTVSQQPTNAPVVRAVLQRTVNMSSTAARTVPPQQQRTAGYSRHAIDARSTQTSSTHTSPVVSRSVTTDATSRTVAAPLKSTTVMTTSHRLLLPRLPAGALQPVSTVSGQTVPGQPPVQAATSVAPVLVQATTLQDVRWSQHQQSRQLCVAVPGFRVVQAPSFQGRAVAAAPPPLQWCGPPMAVGRPIAANILRPPATIPPFPWGGFVPQDPRFVGRAPLNGPQAHPGQAMPTQQVSVLFLILSCLTQFVRLPTLHA